MTAPEPWLDKRGLAEHLCCSVRSLQTALSEGMPHVVIFGRVKFRASEVEPWLEENGYLTRNGGTMRANIERPGGAGTPRARTGGGNPHAS